MKRIVTSVLIVMCSFKWSVAQEVSSNHFDNYPIVLTIQFQSFSLPFKNIKGHFRNIGIGIGTEVSHNGNHNWVQHFDFIWYRNSTMGNGIIISTQAGWRPFLRDPVYSELKFGIAYFHNFRPVESYKQNNTGEWVSIGKKGGGTLAIPIGIRAGVYQTEENIFTAPFMGYQFMLTTNYAKSLPVTPWSFIEFGTSTHLK